MLPEFNLKDRNVRTCDGASVCQTRAQSSDVQNVTAESSTWGLSQLLATYERRAEQLYRHDPINSSNSALRSTFLWLILHRPWGAGVGGEGSVKLRERLDLSCWIKPASNPQRNHLE